MNSALCHLNIRWMMFNLVLTLAFSHPTFGQGAKQSSEFKKHSIGLKGGQNASWVRFVPAVDVSRVSGPVFGIGYSLVTEKQAGLILEILYSQYGWEEIISDTTTNYGREMKYIEMPLMSQLILGKGKTNFRFTGGLKMNLLLSESESSPPVNSTQLWHGRKIDDPIELGLAFGAAIARHMGPGYLMVDGRFNMTLSNLFAPPEDFTLEQSQNQALTVSFSYWFSF